MLRNSTNSISIKPKISSRNIIILSVVGLLLSICALYGSYISGLKSGNSQLSSDQSRIDELKDSITTLEDKLSESNSDLIYAERQQQIQEEAYKKMSRAHSGAQSKNRYLVSRLDFYRSIISPESGKAGKAGAQIQDLAYEVKGDVLKFDITLIQVIKHKYQVRGNVKVSLYKVKAGKADESSVIAKWPASGIQNANFQYFQKVSGELPITEIGESAKIKVELVLGNKKTIERWFDFNINQPVAKTTKK